MQFQPFQSSVEVGFWSALAKHKLEVQKLSEAGVPLLGLYRSHQARSAVPSVVVPSSSSSSADAAVPAAHDEVPSRLCLDGGSFNTTDPRSDIEGAYIVPGELHNTNTIEAFRDLDKKALFHHAALQVHIPHLIQLDSIRFDSIDSSGIYCCCC